MGVAVDTATARNRWAIPTEVSATDSNAREWVFTLRGTGQTECYYPTHCRRFGANKCYLEGHARPAARFAVWAPNARKVERVFGDWKSGYIYPDGRGINAQLPRITMRRDEAGIWSTDGAVEPALADFAALNHQPYMHRVTRDDGSVAYRSDLYSRCQIGSGWVNPEQDPSWSGNRSDVDGAKGCSVVIDPGEVCRPFRQLDVQRQPVWPETDWVAETDFWRGKLDPDRPLPTRLQDLVIYELHVDGLGFGRRERGLLEDAIDLLDYLVELGVNCVELMPASESEGWSGWSYGTSHYLAVEYAAGGRDQFKHFVRECHRRGITVLLNVVYNYIYPRRRACPVGLRLHRSGAQHLLLVRRSARRLSEHRRRLYRQYVDWLRAPVLGGDGAQAVHLLRRPAGGRVPPGRLPRRPDHLHSQLRRGARRRPPGGQCPHLRSQVPA